MRRLAACLLVLACGCGDDDDGTPDGAGGASGRSDSSGAGAGGDAQRAGAGASGSAGGDRASAPGGTGGSAKGSGASGGGKPASGSGGANGGDDRSFGMITLVPHVVAGAQTGTGGGIGSSAFALRVGSPASSTLHSLKYYVTSIQLCEDLQLMGSGFQNATGCIALYTNQDASSPVYDTYTVAAAQADNAAGHYIDLMSSEGRAALQRPVTVRVPISRTDEADGGVPDSDADGGTPETAPLHGVFRYGLINFYRPIKVTAEFPIVGEPGQLYRTKRVDKVDVIPSPSGGLGNERVEIGDTLAAPTEETVYMLNNGGVIFTFQKPFAITQADIDAHTEISIDLVFNPENFGQAYAQQDCRNDTHSAICDPKNDVVIDMPYVRMSPVPRKGSEKTRKETYLVDYDGDAKLRIELYYNDADTDKRVQGVDAAIVYTAAPSSNGPSINIVASNFVTQTGNALTLQDYRRMTSLDRLSRRQDGTLRIHCLFTGAFCPSLGGHVARAYRYVGDTLVSGAP